MAKLVEIDGMRYVPQEQKIPQEVIDLLSELVKAAEYRSPLKEKLGRLQYLLTDGNGRAR